MGVHLLSDWEGRPQAGNGLVETSHGFGCGWWGEEEGTFPHKCRAGREDRVLSTVPRANYGEAVRHTFYFVIIDLEEGQNSCLAGDNLSQSLCRETILTFFFFLSM